MLIPRNPLQEDSRPSMISFLSRRLGLSTDPSPFFLVTICCSYNTTKFICSPVTVVDEIAMTGYGGNVWWSGAVTGMVKVTVGT
jgi:hypothetical protein